MSHAGGLVCGLAILLTSTGAIASMLDGEVLGHTTIVDRGPAANRYNLVFMAEGYRDAELGKFRDDAARSAAALVSSTPFDDCHVGINIHRVDVTSTDSGVDAGDFDHRTFFDSYFYGRLILTNLPLVSTVASAQVPEWDVVLLIVNDDQHYGGGGTSRVAVAATGSGTNVPIHELGHAAFGLADEYEYANYCGGDVNQDHHPPVEPSEPNVTVARTRAAAKWAHLIALSTPVPTTQNPDCARCDVQASPVTPGTVGLFEGAHYYHCDAFRGAFDCRMRENGQPFCAVCTDRITRVLAPFQRRCGDGLPDLGCNETCDDGNLVDGDGCDSTCRPTGCGSGVRTGDERCDDGNTSAGDGCSPDCRLECHTVNDCTDDDPCEIRECTEGLCAFGPAAGIAGASCRLEQIQRHLPCGTALPAKLRRAIIRRVHRALVSLEKAGRSPKPGKGAKQLRRARTAITAIDATAGALLARHKVGLQCRDEVRALIDDPRAIIDRLAGT